MNKKLTGAIVAAAVAGLFLTGKARAAEEQKAAGEAKKPMVQCEGTNECKGKGSCHGASNECAGKNGCKGKGWIKVESEKECTDKGGKVVAGK